MTTEKHEAKPTVSESNVERLVMPDHDIIYLLPDGDGGASWCDDPAPGTGMEERDAIKYIREDCTYRKAPCKKQCESKAFEIEIKQLKSENESLKKDILDWENEFLI